eukprot:5258232-Amphidinium_carterae.2
MELSTPSPFSLSPKVPDIHADEWQASLRIQSLIIKQQTAKKQSLQKAKQDQSDADSSTTAMMLMQPGNGT